MVPPGRKRTTDASLFKPVTGNFKIPGLFLVLPWCYHIEEFKRHRRECENQRLDFTGTVDEQYNVHFTLLELHTALTSAGNTSPGPDRIHYSRLKHFSEDAQLNLFSFYNKLWRTIFSLMSSGPLQWYPYRNPARNLVTIKTTGSSLSLAACVSIPRRWLTDGSSSTLEITSS